jgi:hypothetical protein
VDGIEHDGRGEVKHGLKMVPGTIFEPAALVFRIEMCGKV